MTHLVTLAEGHRLQKPVALAFAALQADARAQGFDLAIASGFRSFERQLGIWNGKLSGQRPVHDDAGECIALQALSDQERLHAVMRFSAIPGTSRHHWGTDLDVYDRAAMPADYTLQLTPDEVAAGGLFDPLHCWLDQQMQAGLSHGFYRPYAHDRGGVACERWHLSYAPLAQTCEAHLDLTLLQACWDDCSATEPLLLREAIEAQWPALWSRYIAVEEGWCLKGQ
tara:strand:- start:26270 stop:26947 length:678 start_codon:yes stop_codon:yes gene_type:complete